MLAGPGNDTVDAGSGFDVVWAGEGNDNVSGGDGPDALGGGPGNDVLSGGNHRDRVAGGPGADTLRGGDGPDLLIAGEKDGQADSLDCGAGVDRAVVREGEQTTVLNCEQVKTLPAAA